MVSIFKESLLALTNLFNPPSKFALPLVKGDDLSVVFNYEDPDNAGSLLDWPAGIEVWLFIDSATPIAAQAVITGHAAAVTVESELTDAVKRGALWRLVVKQGTLDTVACNGTVIRSDGG